MRTIQARLHFPTLPHPHPPTHPHVLRHPFPPQPTHPHTQVRRVGLDQTLLEVSGTLEVFPCRTILLPATLLLPEVVPIRATLQIGVEGPLDVGAVELVVAKWVSVTHSDWLAALVWWVDVPTSPGWGVAAALFLLTGNLGAWSSALL